MAIFLLAGSEKKGPFDEAAVREMIAQGTLDLQTPAWREGMTEWRPVATLFPPPPASAISQGASPRPIARPAFESPAERVLWRGRPSVLSFFVGFPVGVLLLVIGGLMAVLSRDPVTIPAGATAGGTGLLTLLVISLQCTRRSYTVTTRKVQIEVGLSIKRSEEIRIEDIQSIVVCKTRLGRLFGIGGIEFSSAAADKAEVIFAGVAGVSRVRDLVRAQQEA